MSRIVHFSEELIEKLSELVSEGHSTERDATPAAHLWDSLLFPPRHTLLPGLATCAGPDVGVLPIADASLY